MREHQIGIALYCALGTWLPIRGRISPLSAGGHNSPFSGGPPSTAHPQRRLLVVVHALGPPSLSAQQSTGVVLGHVLQVLDVVAGPRVLAGPVQPPPRLAVLLVAGYPVTPGDVPTLGVNLPIEQPRADGLVRWLDKFPGLGYPDLDKLATHELTLMELIEAVSDQTRSDSSRKA